MRWKGAGKSFLRWGVWALLGWIFIRGVISFVPQPLAEGSSREGQAGSASEPPGLRATAEMFAREYLTWSPGDPAERAPRLRPYLAQSVERQAGWMEGDPTIGQQVEQTWIYALEPISPTRWQAVTAVRVSGYQQLEAVDGEGALGARSQLGARTLYLAVPLAQVEGGWLVYDYPSLVPPPQPGAFTEPLYYGQGTSDLDGRVQALLTDFFRAYLTGGNITYFLAPGTALAPIEPQLREVHLRELRLVESSNELWALADIQAQDPLTSARYTFRYTVRLHDLDGRWFVADLLEKGD